MFIAQLSAARRLLIMVGISRLRLMLTRPRPRVIRVLFLKLYLKKLLELKEQLATSASAPPLPLLASPSPQLPQPHLIIKIYLQYLPPQLPPLAQLSSLTQTEK